MAEANVATWEGSDVDVTRIETKLAQLWKGFTRDAPLSGAVRTSIFNLVIYAGSETSIDQICGILDQLAQVHPSRTIILVGDRSSDRCALDCSLRVHCRPKTETQLPLCYEEVVVKARGQAADHLASVVIPLLLPGLPTYLWWPEQPPFGYRTFHQLLATADQLVLDSAHFSSPADGLADLARLTTGKQGVNDFHWSRLTPWRDIIAQFFDAPNWLPYADGILSVRIEFGAGGDGRSATAGTLLLLGWLASQLGWEPETPLEDVAVEDLSLSVRQGERVIPVELRFREHGEAAAGLLMGIELVSQPKGAQPARFSMNRGNDLDHAEIKMALHGGPEMARVVPLDNKEEAGLLAEELELPGHDRLYETVVDRASRLAGREVWVPA